MIITAFRRDTGEKVRVPAHYFEHPTLGAPFVKTKPVKKAAVAASDSKKENKNA